VEITGEQVVLRPDCVGCQACLTACPGGVFTLSRNEAGKRRQALKQSLKDDPVARFTCFMDSGKEREGVVTVPCLAGLSEGDLLAPLAWGGEQVQIKRMVCQGCPLEGGLTQYDRTLKRAIKLLSCFGITDDHIQEVGEFDPLRATGGAAESTGQQEVGRREFFSLFHKRAIKNSLDLIPSSEEGLDELRWSHGENPHRAFLLSLLPRLGDVQNAILSSEDLPAVDLEISGRCVGCNVCETLCPTGAIRREVGDSDKVTLFFTLAKCTGCRVCAAACLPKAIAYSETIDLAELVGCAEKRLVEVTGRRCRICREPFSGLPGDTCPSCLHLRRNGIENR
jgi:formate hydrogenlyase subunit 6/NADH:ubiquinone oxidoreductase subunit I